MRASWSAALMVEVCWGLDNWNYLVKVRKIIIISQETNFDCWHETGCEPESCHVFSVLSLIMLLLMAKHCLKSRLYIISTSLFVYKQVQPFKCILGKTVRKCESLNPLFNDGILPLSIMAFVLHFSVTHKHFRLHTWSENKSYELVSFEHTDT